MFWWEPPVLVFMWMPLDSHQQSKHCCRPTTSARHCALQHHKTHLGMAQKTWERAWGINLETNSSLSNLIKQLWIVPFFCNFLLATLEQFMRCGRETCPVQGPLPSGSPLAMRCTWFATVFGWVLCVACSDTPRPTTFLCYQGCYL